MRTNKSQHASRSRWAGRAEGSRRGRNAARFAPHSSLVALLLAVTACGPAVRGQDDWEAAEQEIANQPAGQAQQVHFELPEETFNQWVFGNQNAGQARAAMEASLTLQIEAVARVCPLSDAQRKKLRMAGYGDMKRFDDETEVVRKKFQEIRRDQNKINQIWQDIQPLQTKYQAGLFHDTSLFHKVLRRTLDPQQAEQYEQQESERRRFRFEAKIGLAIATIEKGVPFRDEQRQELMQLLLEETEPPPSYGQYSYYLVLYKAANIPEEKLKPLFDDAQWQAMRQLFAQARQMEAQLKRNGHLP